MRPVCRLLLLLHGLLFLVAPAWPADTGGPIFRGVCTQILAPVTGRVLCWEVTTQTLRYWNGSTWVATGATSVAGTTNEITASAATGTVTLSLPATIIAPGSLTATTFLNTPRLNNIRYANQYPGATADAKIAAAIADLPSEGGVVDARGLVGSQSIAATVTLDKRVQLWLSTASWTCTATICFDLVANRSGIVGQGQNATIIRHNPTANGAITFRLANGANVIAQNAIRGVTCDGTGDTHTKTCIQIIDGEEIEVSDYAVSNWSDAGKLSMGVQVMGRQTILLERGTVFADKPLRFSINPNNGIDVDHTVVRDFYGSANGRPVVTIDDGAMDLTNLQFTGYQTWNNGTHGLYWVQTVPGGSTSQALSIAHVRREQEEDATSYTVYIDVDTSVTSGLRGLVLHDISGTTQANGVFLRGVTNTQFTSFQHTLASGVAIDVGSIKNNGVNFDSTWTQPGASVITAGATNLSGQINVAGNPPIAFSFPGNAATATALQTARTINGVSFDGTANITVTVPISTGVTGLGSGIATWLATPSGANLTSALTTALTVAGGGTGDTGTGWTSYTPTVTCQTGTPTTTSSSGFYKTIGKTVFVKVRATITTVGTCAGSVQATLPITSAASNGAYVLAGHEAATGQTLWGTIDQNTALVSMRFYDNTTAAADGHVLRVAGVYEGS